MGIWSYFLDFGMPIIYQETYRPAGTPVRDLPFGVRSTGHYKIKPPFTSINYMLTFLQLFWCVRGSGIVEFEGRRRLLKRHQVALYYPNMHHYWYADRQPWEFYWLTLDGPFAVSLPAAFGLKAGIYDAGPAPVTLFQTLRRLVGKLSKQAELHAGVIAFRILSRAAVSPKNYGDELVNSAVERIHQQYVLPTLNIKTLSALLGIRRAVLSARFNDAMGMPPSVYLERLRVQKALSLLKNTNFSIAVISSQCGYRDTDYFSRVIRRATGRSPLQIRKQYYHFR